MNRNSLVYQADSYKVSHWLQFPEDTRKTFYYIESRGGADELMFFGLQAILKDLRLIKITDRIRYLYTQTQCHYFV